MKKLIGILATIIAMSMPLWASPRAYPVPYIEKEHASLGISFVDLPASGTIKIVTISGEEVVKLDIPQGLGRLTGWHPSNSSGKALATGVYFFFIDGAGTQTTGKLVIIR